MAFRIFTGLIVSFLISLSVWADEIKINPSHPDQYTVTKSDTLWDISGKFLTHPWQWPELWKNNTQIKNPHLIYPGDTIYFSMVDGKPQLSLSRNELPHTQTQADPNSPCVLKEEDYKYGRKDFAVSKEGKVLPCIRETEIKQAIKLIPTENIMSFLSSPKVVDENELNNAPYVVDFAGEHIVVGPGDRVYVRSITDPNNLSYTIYRPGSAYISPESGEILGYEAQYIADASLEQPGDPATLTITKSAREIRTGDRIMPNAELDIALNYFPRPPEQSIKGSIISVLGGVSQIGRYNVVVIDKGTADGLLPGHELNIYKTGKIIRDTYSPIKNDAVNLPDEIAGTLMVFRPFERVSYALVMKATQALHVLDKVRTP
ncbi:LysM domain-containing protein [Methylobacter sp.]|uniref:LysM peptidoglycan-binding domain-containing protein n=1 Tax=Methylobacter sp. TaxID=2051955 RepID=UPI0011F68809|nr:LysM domain-containing protein [Methylobacter sp.]TAK62306.1 MAG: LysM peptidoglycan-binding domain-containing protein [Methylobacter sp.]